MRLAGDAARLRAVRQRLARARATAPLFDMAAYTRRLEAAFAAMLARAREGLPPAGFGIPA